MNMSLIKEKYRLRGRAIKLISPHFTQQILIKLKQIFLYDNYPENFINNIFKKLIHKFYNNHIEERTINYNKYVSFPFIK